MFLMSSEETATHTQIWTLNRSEWKRFTEKLNTNLKKIHCQNIFYASKTKSLLPNMCSCCQFICWHPKKDEKSVKSWNLEHKVLWFSFTINFFKGSLLCSYFPLLFRYVAHGTDRIGNTDHENIIAVIHTLNWTCSRLCITFPYIV